MIARESKHGAPYGSYDVYYYRINNGWARVQSNTDSNVSLDYVKTIKPRTNEVAVAVCKSQPGGMTIYGSSEARTAFLREFPED